jgi:hypothetical protein
VSSSGVQTCGNSWPWFTLNNVPAGSGEQVAQDCAFDVNGFHGVGLIGASGTVALRARCFGCRFVARCFSESVALCARWIGKRREKGGVRSDWSFHPTETPVASGSVFQCFGDAVFEERKGRREATGPFATPMHRAPQAQPGGNAATDLSAIAVATAETPGLRPYPPKAASILSFKAF